MIERKLEDEVMDTPEEAADYDAMDHTAVNRAFVADFLAVWNGRGPILDVGTGTAQIPIEFCRQSAAGEVVAVDLAEAMLAAGRRNVQAAGCGGRVRLEKANARQLPYADGSFAAVMSNSIVHHIPEPPVAVAEMARVAAVGATMFVRDLFRPDDEATIEALLDKHAPGANAHQRKMFGDSMRAALTLDEVRAIVTGLGFAADSVRQTTDRHWTWAATK